MSDAATPDAGSGERMKKFEGPVTVERSFKVDGKRLTVQVTFPAPVVKEFGMETLVAASNRAIINVDSKQHRVERITRGS